MKSLLECCGPRESVWGVQIVFSNESACLKAVAGERPAAGQEWLQQGPDRCIGLHCFTGFQRSIVFAACFLAWQGIPGLDG